MPYFSFTPGTVAATDPLGQAFQRSLDLLDAGLVVAFNTKRQRFEVWTRTLDARGVFYGFVMRVEGPKGEFVEPGEWFLEQLRARDSRYAGANTAAKNVLAEIRESERKALEDDEKRDADRSREVTDEIAYDYTLEAQLASDPHYTGRRHYEWDPAPVSQPVKKSLREAIRDAAKSPEGVR